MKSKEQKEYEREDMTNIVIVSAVVLLVISFVLATIR